jgi:hypothetical protein
LFIASQSSRFLDLLKSFGSQTLIGAILFPCAASLS